LTPRGVAAFASATWCRLLTTQCIVSLLAAGVAVWFLETSLMPVVRDAVRHLPAEGEIRDQQLFWRGASPVKLAGNELVNIGVDLYHSGQLVRESDVQFEFGKKNLRVSSMFGYAVLDYPVGWRLAFNRTELDPWWEAREPWIAAAAAIACVLGLLLSWNLLAAIYCVPVRIITLYENRDLGWRSSWKLAGAALLPGALFLTAGIAACALHFVGLVQLGVCFVLHVVIGWIYLFISPLFLPRVGAGVPARRNPFTGSTRPASDPRSRAPNPFKAD